MRVLVVSHHATRTGAPRVAALVARSLVERGDDVRILSRHPGPLMGDFEQVAPTSTEPLRRVRARCWRIAPTLARSLDTLLAAASLVRRRPDLVYVNCSTAAVYVRAAVWLSRPVVLHVHESGAVAATFLRSAGLTSLPEAVRVVACSPSVQVEVADLLGRDLDEVALVPSVPDEHDVRRLAGQEPDRDYDPDELVVGCCGAVEHRKGVDLWVEVAAQVRAALPDRRVRFVWVGDGTARDGGPGLGAVDFVGPSANPYAHLRRFDVATLTSRDDPFPLVVLEAMLVGTPVVAFGVGGVPDQIGGAGVVVPPGDTSAFARAVLRLLDDSGERRRLGALGRVRAESLFSSDAFGEGVRGVVEHATAVSRVRG